MTCRGPGHTGNGREKGDIRFGGQGQKLASVRDRDFCLPLMSTGGGAVYSLKNPFPCTLFHLLRNVGPCDPLESMVKGVSGRGGGNGHCSEWLAWDISPDGGLCLVL